MTDYREAIQYPSFCFSDPLLVRGVADKDRLGLPKVISGNFALVFPFVCGGKRSAIRVFSTYHPDQEKRYAVIHSYLARHQLPYWVDFVFLRQGLKVNGQWYPLLKMDWVDGEPLNAYIEQHLHDPAAIRSLAHQFTTMISELQRLSIAHGDLQHGNILLVNGSLKLVDYDSMFVPGLEGLSSHELGHRNYQSPIRTESDFGAHLDRFSAWVIYASLEALASDPTLWRQFGKDREGLLFCRDDFLRADSSQVLDALDECSDEKVRGLGWQIRSLADMHLSLIPALGAGDALPKAPRSNWSRTLKRVEAMITNRNNQCAVGAGSDWVLDHLPQRRPESFSGSLQTDRLMVSAFFVVAMVCSSVIALSLGALPLVLAMVVCAVLLTGSLAILYYRIPEVRRKSALLVQRRVKEEQTRLATISMEKLSQDMDHMVREAMDLVSKLKAQHSEATSGLKEQLRAIKEDLRKGIESAERDKRSIKLAEATEKQKTLKEIQNSFVIDALYRVPLAGAAVAGIGKGNKRDLARSGIRTAADICNIETVRKGGFLFSRYITYIVVRNGGRIRVRGIGPQKAAALLSWRIRQESLLKASLPHALPWTAESEIASRSLRKQALVDERVNIARRNARLKEQAIRSKLSEAETKAVRELEVVQERFVNQVAPLESEHDHAVKRLANLKWEREKMDLEFQRYRNIRFGAYARKLLSRY